MAIGMGELGWSPSEFWASTLPELLAAMRGRTEKEKAAYWRTGEMVAAIYNAQRDTKKYGMLSAPDIFPFLLTPQQHATRAWAKLEGTIIDEDEP